MALAHDLAGDGPTVLLVHSTVCDRRMWDPQVPALVDAGFRVVRCDLRGFGQTPAPDRPYDNARDVADLLDLVGVRRAALVGASGGGRVALEVAARWPQRVTRLALLCTAWVWHEPTARLRAFLEREAALIDAGDIDAATDLNVRTWLGSQADPATREAVRRMQRHAFDVHLAGGDVEQVASDADLSAVTAPSLLVSGRHDLPDFREIAVHLAGRLPGARHIELSWAGHLPSLEQPDAVNPILLDFLSGAA